MGMSIPTVGLITSLPGAAHFSGGTSVRSIVPYVSYIGLIVGLRLVPFFVPQDIPQHEKFRPTFADGEDRTKLDPARQQILDDTLQLFCARPTPEIFERHWHPVNSSFEYEEFRFGALTTLFSCLGRRTRGNFQKTGRDITLIYWTGRILYVSAGDTGSILLRCVFVFESVESLGLSEHTFPVVRPCEYSNGQHTIAISEP
jgi:hypothetical protein